MIHIKSLLSYQRINDPVHSLIIAFSLRPCLLRFSSSFLPLFPCQEFFSLASFPILLSLIIVYTFHFNFHSFPSFLIFLYPLLFFRASLFLPVLWVYDFPPMSLLWILPSSFLFLFVSSKDASTCLFCCLFLISVPGSSSFSLWLSFLLSPILSFVFPLHLFFLLFTSTLVTFHSLCFFLPSSSSDFGTSLSETMSILWK